MKCAQKPGKPGKPIKMAAGGILAGMESAIDESARRRAEIARKYGVTTGDTVPQPKVEQPAKADQAKPHPQEKGILSGIKGIFTRRNEEIDKAASGYARGGILAGLDESALHGSVAQISGPGTGTSDSIPAKLGDTEFKVSNREGIAVLPEKTMRTPGAVDAVKNIIQMTNGLPPKLAIAKGIGFAAGLVEEEKSKDMTAQLDAATKAAQTPPATTAAPSTPFPGMLDVGTSGQRSLVGQLFDRVGDRVNRDRAINADLPDPGPAPVDQSKLQPVQRQMQDSAGVQGQSMPSTPGAQESMVKKPEAPVLGSGLYGLMPGATGAYSNSPKGIADLSTLERSNKAFALSQEIDKATGTGPGATLDASLKPGAPQRVDFGTMGKRFDAYQNNPDLLAKRNEREELLGSGIRLEKDANGGLLLTNTGNADGAVPGGGASTINMKEGNEVIARANAIRQSMIDSQPRGSVGVIGGGTIGGRDDLLKKLMTPHAGAPNGQLTANQIKAARGIMADVNEEQLKWAEIAQRGNETDRRMSNDAIAIEQSRFMLDLQRRAAAGDQAAINSLSAMKGIDRPTPSVRDQYLPLESQTTDNSGNVTKSTQYIDPNTGRVVGGQAGASSNGKELPAGVKPQPGKTYLGMMNGKPVFQDANGNKFVDNSYSAG